MEPNTIYSNRITNEIHLIDKNNLKHKLEESQKTNQITVLNSDRVDRECGKTTLVSWYSFEQQKKGTLVFWLSMNDKHTLYRDLVQLIAYLKPEQILPPDALFDPETNKESNYKLLLPVLFRLLEVQDRKVLLVFDSDYKYPKKSWISHLIAYERIPVNIKVICFSSVYFCSEYGIKALQIGELKDCDMKSLLLNIPDSSHSHMYVYREHTKILLVPIMHALCRILDLNVEKVNDQLHLKSYSDIIIETIKELNQVAYKVLSILVFLDHYFIPVELVSRFLNLSEQEFQSAVLYLKSFEIINMIKCYQVDGIHMNEDVKFQFLNTLSDRKYYNDTLQLVLSFLGYFNGHVLADLNQLSKLQLYFYSNQIYSMVCRNSRYPQGYNSTALPFFQYSVELLHLSLEIANKLKGLGYFDRKSIYTIECSLQFQLYNARRYKESIQIGLKLHEFAEKYNKFINYDEPEKYTINKILSMSYLQIKDAPNTKVYLKASSLATILNVNESDNLKCEILCRKILYYQMLKDTGKVHKKLKKYQETIEKYKENFKLKYKSLSIFELLIAKYYIEVQDYFQVVQTLLKNGLFYQRTLDYKRHLDIRVEIDMTNIKVLYELGDFPNALKLLNDLLEILSPSHKDIYIYELGQIHLYLAKCSIECLKFDMVLVNLNQSKFYFEKFFQSNFTSSMELVDLYQCFGYYYYKCLNQIDQASNWFNQSFETVKLFDVHTQIPFKLEYIKFRIHTLNGPQMKNELLQLIQMEFNLVQELVWNVKLLKSDVLEVQGLLHLKLKEYNDAFLSFDQSYQLRKSNLPCNNLKISKSLDYLGKVQMKLKQYKKSKESFKLAMKPKTEILKVFKEFNLPIHQSNINLAKVNNRMGLVYKSISLYSQVYKETFESSNFSYHFGYLKSMVKVLMKWGELQTDHSHFIKSKEILEYLYPNDPNQDLKQKLNDLIQRIPNTPKPNPSSCTIQ